MSVVKYRKAGERDVTAISLLWAEYFDYHFSLDTLYKRHKDSDKDIAEFLAKAVKDNDTFIYVAEYNEKVIGYVWCEINKKPPCFVDRFYGFVSDIAVTEEQRGQGVAKELLNKGMEWFKKKNITHVEARVLKFNHLATKFWQSSGFEPFVEILRYKFEK